MEERFNQSVAQGFLEEAAMKRWKR